ncbi:LacI family DNA-binding transcriptional regulator [Schaalia vaccimaxillae]|uniref:LacI family DNA-binding transcriptional regulator n=1 Tax=Schaalia vaccimaxillae TaxID=183916 RepID=UPI0003B3FF25|nr:LacI family DNA-binding transcriptional regulator [Schaalia vaccimaxillae]
MTTPNEYPKKPTLDDIAAAAQVSKATVSKALNGRRDIAYSTRTRILNICEELGYRHTSNTAQQQRSIALVSDNLATTYSLEVLKGATNAAMRANINLNLSHLAYAAIDKPQAEPLTPKWALGQQQNGCIGVITLTTATTLGLVETLRNARLAHVSIDPATPPPTGSASIGATNWNGGVEATQHLIELGHKRIGFICGPSDSVPSRERFEGYRSALRMHHLHFDPDLVDGDNFTYENGHAVAQRLLRLPTAKRPTAIFASNDMGALGVYEAARELGLRIPEDLSVVGFDDTNLAHWATPRLTTVHQPLHDMGARAVETLIAINNGNLRTHGAPIQLSTALIIRNSTAAPRN